MSEEAATTKTLPVLPLKNTVLFPYLLMPLSVGRSASLAAVQAALGNGGQGDHSCCPERPGSRDCPARRICMQSARRQ